MADESTEEPQDDIEARRANGEFVRRASVFRGKISGGSVFLPELNRYHLYVALNCPWCHRVLVARNILGLQKSISVDVAFPNRTNADSPYGPDNWEFAPDRVASSTGAALPECTMETATGRSLRIARQIYEAEGATGSSLPILFDKSTQTIVSNESADILRMLNDQAGALGSTIAADERVDLYPSEERNPGLRVEIDRLNQVIYANINNGAYKAGFSANQQVYEIAFKKYFSTLQDLEEEMAVDGRPFLTGVNLTEADVRLFPTLFRHDPVYFLRMKLNGARMLDFPNLWRWICRVYGIPGVSESGSLTHCLQGYFGRSWNNVVPLGPIHPMHYPEAYRHPELANAAMRAH